jgi:hypothetical protein
VATATEHPGTIVQAWVPVPLAVELKARAAIDDRSVSAEIRDAITSYLAPPRRRRPMSDWQISVPYRNRSDRIDLADVADMSRKLEGDDAKVARALALLAVTDSGWETYGDLIDGLEAAGPTGRRQILDRAREGAGLPTTGKLEAERAFKAAQPLPSAQSLRDSRGCVPAICSEPGCPNILADDRLGSGSVAMVPVRRWWCDEHRAGHEADLEPYRPRLALSSSGLSHVDLDELEAEAERGRIEAESRRRQHEAREAEARADAERYAELEAAERERFHAVLATSRRQS